MTIEDFWDIINQALAGAVTNAKNKTFLMLRYETEYTRCGGIASVSMQERRNFYGGIMLAPWCPAIARTREDLPIEPVDGAFSTIHKLFITTDRVPTPIVYLSVDSCFNGEGTPYNTPDMKRDALYFGLAVEEFMAQARDHDIHFDFVWGADWQSVPALYRIRQRFSSTIALTLHNTYDEWLGAEAALFNGTFEVFCGTKTALQIGLESVDVRTTVNRGFAWGIKNEVFHTTTASHLQPILHTKEVIGIDNAVFIPLQEFENTLNTIPALIPLIGPRKLLDMFRKSPEQGAARLYANRKKYIKHLKETLDSLSPLEKTEKYGIKVHGYDRHFSRLADDKVIITTMGRLEAQKQFEVFTEVIGALLDPANKYENRNDIIVFFSFMLSGPENLPRIKPVLDLYSKYPDKVIYYLGFSPDRNPYFNELRASADFACMTSLYEPHGEAFAGTIVPIVRAVDGLAEQVCDPEAEGEARRYHLLWHDTFEEQTGFVYREPESGDPALLRQELSELSTVMPVPHNGVFNAMVESLTETIKKAVQIRLTDKDRYAQIVHAALEKQEGTSWVKNLDGMLRLIP